MRRNNQYSLVKKTTENTLDINNVHLDMSKLVGIKLRERLADEIFFNKIAPDSIRKTLKNYINELSDLNYRLLVDQNIEYRNDRPFTSTELVGTFWKKGSSNGVDSQIKEYFNSPENEKANNTLFAQKAFKIAEFLYENLDTVFSPSNIPNRFTARIDKERSPANADIITNILMAQNIAALNGIKINDTGISCHVK